MPRSSYAELAATATVHKVHAFEIATHLRLIDTISEQIAGLDARIEQQLASIPGVAPTCGRVFTDGARHEQGSARRRLAMGLRLPGSPAG